MHNDDKKSTGFEVTLPSQQRGTIVSNQGVTMSLKSGQAIHGNAVGGDIVYLLIDCSTSMAEENKLEHAKKGALDFAKQAREKGYAIGLIKFAFEAEEVCAPLKDIARLAGHFETVHAMGNTNMAAALALACEKLKNTIGNRVAVLVTDGEPTEGEPNPVDATLREAARMREYGIDIITIGTDDADEGFLRRIATRDDLAVMVERTQLERGVSSLVKMLPEPR
ncbi:MAG: vWA domain-containing protein [Patescibacteria group bacterium]